MNTTLRIYTGQRIRAKQRDISWEFTYDSWLSTWQKSGHFHQRGKGSGKYVMARLKDIGPYSPSNVEIILYEKNARDCRENNPISLFENVKKSLGKGKGFSFRNGAYQVVVSHKYIGLFKTQQLAENAYKNAVEQRFSQILQREGITALDKGALGNGRAA